jgi:cytochrome P450 family 2 subfamily J
VTTAHQSRLPYAQAFIQEFWRLGLILPIQPQHMTLDDTTIAGYAVPKGTIVIAQTNTVHLNPVNYPGREIQGRTCVAT